MKTYPHLTRRLVLALILTGAMPASAINLTWTNTAGGDWAVAANWSPNQVPTVSDVAVFDGAATYTVTLTGARSVGGIVMANPNATLRLLGRNTSAHATLTLTNGFANAGTIELTSQDSNWNATLNVTSGTVTNLAGGVLRVLEGTAGTRTLGLELDNRGTLNIERSTSLTKGSGKHRFGGTVNLAAGTTLTIGGGGAIDTTHAGANWTGTGTLDLPVGRPFILEADFTLPTVAISWQNVTIQGPGTFIKPVDRPLTLHATTINAPFQWAGELVVWGSCSITTPFNVPPGSTLRLLGRNTSAGATLTVPNGFENAGIIELTSENSNWNATLTVTSGTLTNLTGGVLRILEGTAGARTLNLELDNRGTLQIERNTSLTKGAGKHRFAGTVSLTADATLTIGGGGLIDTTHAGANWTGTGTLDLPVGRPFILESDFTLPTITVTWQNVTVQGPGTFIKPVDRPLTLHATTINAPFQWAGELVIWGSCSITTPFDVPAGNTLRLLGRNTSAHATLTVPNGFENAGIIELTSEDSNWGTTLTVASGTLTNLVGGVIRILEGTAGFRTLSLELDNRGTLQIERNTSLTKGAGKHRFAGTVSLAADTTLTIGGGGLIETTHAGANWTGTGTLDLPIGRPFILESDFTIATITVNWQNVTVEGSETLRVPADKEVRFHSTTVNAPLELLGHMEAWNFVTINSPFGIPAGATVRIVGRTGSANAVLTVANGFENHGAMELTSEDSNWGATLTVTSGTFTNAASGVIMVRVGTAGVRNFNLELDNRGTVNIERDTSLNKSGAQHRNSGLIEVAAMEFTLQQTGTTPTFSNSGELRVLAGAIFRPTGGNWTNALTGVLSGAGTFDLSAGTLANLGTVSPGTSPGILGVTANYPQMSGATLALEIGGFTPGSEHDRLAVSATANLNGTLRASLINGFAPKKDDAFTVLTYASRTGSFATLESTEPDRVAWRIEYGPTSAQLIVDNSAPTFAPIANQTVNEEVLFTLNADATDQDLPAQTLTYFLDAAPSGMTINPGSGQINWTPTEAQGPGVYNVTVRVTDNGSPVLSHTNSFTVTVNEVNLAPVLAVVPNATIHAGTTYRHTLSATDADLPANTLTYSLVSGPPGAAVGAGSGEITWLAPLSAVGATTNFTVRVTDNGVPPLTADRSFQVTVAGPLAITTTEREAGGFRVDWNSIPGRTYRLLATPALPAAGWNPVGPDLEATGTIATQLDSAAPNTTNRFYRVQLVE
jgi:hypothetical protein